MGEIEIIIELARLNVSRGDSEINAINNARKQFEFALNEALNYEYKGKKVALRNDKYETEMVKKHSNIVYMVCKRYKVDVFYDEAIQEGFYWLLVSIRSFDESKGVKFTTYAYNHIWQRVYKFMCNFKGAERKRVKNGKTASGNISYNETNEFREFYSLDKPVAGGDEDTSLADLIEVDEKGFSDIEGRELISSIMKTIKKVMSNAKYHGFNMVDIVVRRYEGETYNKIAEALGTYSEMIKRLLKKLQNDLRIELNLSC